MALSGCTCIYVYLYMDNNNSQQVSYLRRLLFVTISVFGIFEYLIYLEWKAKNTIAIKIITNNKENKIRKEKNIV